MMIRIARFDINSKVNCVHYGYMAVVVTNMTNDNRTPLVVG